MNQEKKFSMKPLAELTLLDRFLFACAMEDAENLQLVLQIILGRELELQDGAVRIFLNTHGTNPEEVSEELAELLRYFESTTEETASQCKSNRIKALHRQIVRIKSAEEIGVRYMQEWEEKQYFKEEGRLEGERAKMKKLTAKKLAKGKTAAVIAEELEEEITVIEEIIQELHTDV